ncbi:DUF4136 domain-containing protein [Sphingomonas jatrophae]|uniref:DUF4136 domain-containing protein n=1 Tax=Sphingomonas jatrophae TaxID=1166337 RepID=A0A1I6M8V2_9SPHN|nr:DUF4136 domain-containing protein [Sphingomonas jatrophae]SFS12109.1 protein of unknown function [Sphingomonas jatrophae]
MKAVARALALGMIGLVAACTTSAPQTQVTRFHLGQPIARGQVAVEPLNPAVGGSLEYNLFEGAVSRELARAGFNVAPGVPQSELVAVVSVNRNFREEQRQGSGVSVGLGGGGFSGGRRGGGIGLGGGVSFPIGGGRGREVTATELAVQLKRRSDGTVIWEGRAQTQAASNKPESAPDATAARLANALFAGFPGESGRTISVK